MSLEKAVWRLTKENADFFNLDAGSLEPGRRADLVVVNPEKLNDDVHEYHTAEFLGGHSRLVNRNDDVVDLVLINGKPAWEDGSFTESFGHERFGGFIKASHD
jgi:N-acyl-D-aspartate/D-glutamate deacylase